MVQFKHMHVHRSSVKREKGEWERAVISCYVKKSWWVQFLNHPLQAMSVFILTATYGLFVHFKPLHSFCHHHEQVEILIVTVIKVFIRRAETWHFTYRSLRIKRNFYLIVLPETAPKSSHRKASWHYKPVTERSTHTVATKQVLRCACSVCERVWVCVWWEIVCGCLLVSAWLSPLSLSFSLSSSSSASTTIPSPWEPLIGIMCSDFGGGSWFSETFLCFVT